jgi:hypothetical protein
MVSRTRCTLSSCRQLIRPWQAANFLEPNACGSEYTCRASPPLCCHAVGQLVQWHWAVELFLDGGSSLYAGERLPTSGNECNEDYLRN